MTTRPGSDRGGVSRGRRPVLVLCGIQFVDVLGATVVITALPRLLVDLGATAAQGTAVVTAYAMTFGGALMVAARVGDRVGHRRTLLAALALFGAAAALGATATSVWVLVAARALQGLAAAASVPAALRLLTTLTPPGEARRRAVAAWSAAGAAAGASGFVVGGVLTELASWRAVFVAFVVLAAALVLGVLTSVPADRARAGVRIAWRSGLLLTAATSGLVAGSTLLGEAGSRLVGALLLGTGAAASVAFHRAERRAAVPLVPAEGRRSRELRWGSLGSFANTATTSGSFTLAMLVLQDELGLGPLRAGALLLCFSLLVVVGSAAAPRIIRATDGLRALALGLGTIALGNLVLAGWSGEVGIAVAAAVAGVGIGVGSVAATDTGTQVSEALRATAAGLLNTAAQLGTACGTALVLLLATAADARTAWLVVAAGAAASAGSVVRAGRRARVVT